MAADEGTFVIDTIDDFISQPSVMPGVFGLQSDVMH